MERKVMLYIAMSLDGFIAGKGDDLSFLSVVEKEGEDYGYGDFMAGVDTIIMGRKTYDWVMKQVAEFPHAGMETFIITRNYRLPVGNTQFYTGNLPNLIYELKNKPGKNIFIDGGAEIVDILLQNDLFDEMVISIIPTLVGDGITLFKPGRSFRNLQLVDTKTFEKGLVQLHYSCQRRV